MWAAVLSLCSLLPQGLGGDTLSEQYEPVAEIQRIERCLSSLSDAEVQVGVAAVVCSGVCLVWLEP